MEKSLRRAYGIVKNFMIKSASHFFIIIFSVGTECEYIYKNLPKMQIMWLDGGLK